jgi:ABC-2 type transport system ATP-binding protein
VVSKDESWKTHTAAFVDEQFLIGYLTPEEYFYFVGGLRNMKKDAIDATLEPYKDFFHGEVLGQKKYIRDLSKGNQKKVGIVGTLLSNTPLVILDEPFANLDPTTQIRLKKLLKEEASASGKTFLISSHDLQHITDVCDRIVVLNKGKIVRDERTSSNTLEELEAFFQEQL